MLKQFTLFSNLPLDVINIIIVKAKVKLYDLCLVNWYFNNYAIKLKVTKSNKYKIPLEILFKLPFIKKINLYDADIQNDFMLKYPHFNTYNLKSIRFKNYGPMLIDEHFTMMTNLTNLAIQYHNDVTIKGLCSLQQLKKLSLYNVSFGDDEIKILSQLPNLTNMILPMLVTNKGLLYLTNLLKLNLGCNNIVSDYGLKQLTKLKKLIIDGSGDRITNDGISTLINLTYISDDDELTNNIITMESISCLTNLKKFNFYILYDFKENSLWYLTNLKKLEIYGGNPSPESLLRLTKLKSLTIYDNQSIKNETIKQLTYLKKLNISDSTQITHEGFSLLTQLKSLTIPSSFQADLKYLTNLKIIYNNF